MIVYDLHCANGHAFEGWFENLEDLKRQLADKLITCPVCGMARVERVPSGFAIARKRGEPDHDDAARLLGQALKHYLRDNFDDVGSNFATEALKIHYGVSQSRNIRGVSTPKEEEMLKGEGVGFFKLGQPNPPLTPGGDDEDQ